MEHAQRSERVPPAWFTNQFAKFKGQRLVVRAVEEPSTVGLPPARDKIRRIVDARVGLRVGVPEVVERAKIETGAQGRTLRIARARDLFEADRKRVTHDFP
jgi:hypothetical protein